MDILDVVGGGGWWWIYFGCQWVLCDSGGYIFTGGGGLYRMAVDGAIAQCNPQMICYLET